MKDFLGKEFGPGDLIVYPKMSGRSVCLVKGRVVKFNPSGSVTIQPETESWQGGRERSGTTRYIDTRTGKGFNPYYDGAAQHQIRGYGYIHTPTDTFVEYEDYNNLRTEAYRTPGKWQTMQRDYQWAPVIWKDYVKVENTVKPVTITRTDNILLIEKGDA